MFQRLYSEPCQIKTTKQTACHTDRPSGVYDGSGRAQAALSVCLWVNICVRVCVCVCERERKRDVDFVACMFFFFFMCIFHWFAKSKYTHLLV